jgi:hypothetical protein
MSVHEYLTQAQTIRSMIDVLPECWLIVANGVYQRAEEYTVIAVFDTMAQAENYVDASTLPPEYMGINVHGYYRAFRPDSLLWDYNPTLYTGVPTDSRHAIVHRLRGLVDLSVPTNPIPPTGPVPPDVFATEAARRLAESGG